MNAFRANLPLLMQSATLEVSCMICLLELDGDYWLADCHSNVLINTRDNSLH